MSNIANKGVYIPKIEAKDLYITNYAINDEYTLKRPDGKTNIKRFKASLDYSLDLIKLREVYEAVYRNKRFSEKIKGKEYSPYVVNVTFNYSVKEYNRSGQNTYVKYGYDSRALVYDDCVAIVDGVLAGIAVGKEFEHPISEELLGKYFYIENNKYCAKTNINTIKNVSDVRKDLYINGFNIDGIHYRRYKRSAGSARVGRCLFIADTLFSRMHKWEDCGVGVKPGSPVDLAAYESYISLTSSSIVDTMEIQPYNILVIDDYNSVFDDDVISVTESHGELESTQVRATIENCIWDGQSLMDKSIIPEHYQDKGMLLLRNRFFKSCCFNANIQLWFKDNGITSIDQLNGYTQATSIDQIKLITTPSSIKYLKFGTLKKWLSTVDSTYGIVKYEKPAKFFDNRMTQCHYQLINSIQMSKSEVDEFLKPTFDFMRLVKDNPAVLRSWIKFDIEDLDEITPAESKTDVVYRLMSVCPDFTKTKLYYDFRGDFLRSFTKNIKCGHVLINGNYSTLCGNPISMLKASIGKFDGESEFEVGTVYSRRFEWDKKLLGSRSPHITMSNVLVTRNKHYPDIDVYMNPTPGILYINSINENIMQRLAGCDFDSDTVLLTDNEVLIKAASRNITKFKVAVYNVGGVKVSRKYTPEDLADLDIKTSKNAIGNIINVSQELNTQIWDMLASGAKMSDIMDIYLDVCKLSIMSNIEIDKAKREFIVDNVKELKKICSKRKLETEDGKQIKPNFFKHISQLKGYYNPEKKAYLKHDTSMDYLQTSVNSFRASREGRCPKIEFLNLSDLLDDESMDYKQVNYKQINEVINWVDQMSSIVTAIYSNAELVDSEKHADANVVRQEFIERVGKCKFNHSTMIAMLRVLDKPEHAHHRKTITYILFSFPNESFFNILKKSKKPIDVIEEDPDGDIEIFDVRYSQKSTVSQ